MRRYFQQISRELVIGWLLAIFASAIYLLTLEPTVSFWDSGEFISVAYLLQVGHPPGAPFYQLLAHIFSWFAPTPAQVALCCNALSALSAGFTVMFLFWTILLLSPPDKKIPLPAAVIGSLCYLFCDTAWFSAVESEVYSLAMLIASATLWAMLRWYRCPDHRQAQRWLLLVSLLLGLGFCTHLLTLLTTPALLLLFIFKFFKAKKTNSLQGFFPPALLLFMVLFFAIGLSPYAIVPIRASANPPINQGSPHSFQRLKSYIAREDYEKAPLYPRIWRNHPNDSLYASDWSGGENNFMGNLRYYTSYQLTYMYFRYLMWNFSGRYNDRQGFGSPQNGQFITGIPPIDRLLVGTSARPPESLHTRAHNTYYLLPLLLGLLGFYALSSRRKAFWAVFTLFLMGGIILSLYLNHPTYEPRERDYAYILSFYAFAIFIAFGSEWLLSKAQQFKQNNKKILSRLCPYCIYLIILATPALMAFQNWDDHDRSHRYIAYDSGANILNSCDHHPQRAILFCYGDNDTFPLWYLQQVENIRTDIQVENIALIGYHKFVNLYTQCLQSGRPVYLTHYAYNAFHSQFGPCIQLEGNTYRLTQTPCDSVATHPFLLHLNDMTWHPMQHVYIDETGCKFIEQYWKDILLLADNLSSKGQNDKARWALDKTLSEIPLSALQDVRLIYDIGQACLRAGNTSAHNNVNQYLADILRQQLDYFHTLSPQRQAAMPYTLGPRNEIASLIGIQ